MDAAADTSNEGVRVRRVDTAAEYVATLQAGEDWRAEIETVAEAVGADGAWFTAIGGVRDAEVWFYDQEELRYGPTYVEEPMEVASCIGNVAAVGTDGDPVRYAHTHAVLARPDGSVVAGHLNRATVFVGEVYMEVFDDGFDRKRAATPVLDTDAWASATDDRSAFRDEVTGLDLRR